MVFIQAAVGKDVENPAEGKRNNSIAEETSFFFSPPDSFTVKYALWYDPAFMFKHFAEMVHKLVSHQLFLLFGHVLDRNVKRTPGKLQPFLCRSEIYFFFHFFTFLHSGDGREGRRKPDLNEIFSKRG